MVVASATNTTPGIKIVNGKMTSYRIRYVIDYKSLHRFIIAMSVNFGTRFFSAHLVFLTTERPTMKHRNDVICCVQYKFAVTFVS